MPAPKGTLNLQGALRAVQTVAGEVCQTEPKPTSSREEAEMTQQDEHDSNGRICLRCRVAGRVQGVFFRASAREQAQRHGLNGYARNLADGQVEVLICGDRKAVTEMREWLRSGPAQAEVTGVACETVPYQELDSFATG